MDNSCILLSRVGRNIETLATIKYFLNFQEENSQSLNIHYRPSLLPRISIQI